MVGLLLRLAANMLTLWVAVQFLPGLHFSGGLPQLAGLALVFGVVNTIIKPILKLLTCPLVLLTLGLFTIVLNGALLLLTANFARGFGIDFRVDGWLWAIIGGLVIGLISTIVTVFLPDGDDKKD